MREECIHAGLRRWRIEDELRFAVFLRNRVVVIHSHRSVGIPFREHAHFEDGVIQDPAKSGDSDESEDGCDEPSAKTSAEVWDRQLRHEARL